MLLNYFSIAGMHLRNLPFQCGLQHAYELRPRTVHLIASSLLKLSFIKDDVPGRTVYLYQK